MLGSAHDARDLAPGHAGAGMASLRSPRPGAGVHTDLASHLAVPGSYQDLVGADRSAPAASGVSQLFDDAEAPFGAGVEVPCYRPPPDQIRGELPGRPEAAALGRSRLRALPLAASRTFAGGIRARNGQRSHRPNPRVNYAIHAPAVRIQK